MINLAHNLNLEVVAEGWRTPEQLDLLRGFELRSGTGLS